MSGLLLALMLSAFASIPARANVLIVQISDVHSSYQNYPIFLRALAIVRAEFLARHPAGKTILVVNGDFGGSSAYSFDRGDLGYEVLARLAGEWQILLGLGNHEAFDYPGEEGQRLFLNQHETLRRAIQRTRNESFSILAANVVPAPAAQSLFSSFFDLRLESGRTVRFIGLTLDRFFGSSIYHRGARLQTINEVRPYDETLFPLLENSLSEGIARVFVMVHDGTGRVERLSNLTHHFMNRLRNQRGDHHGFRVEAFLAAHDHQSFVGNAGESAIVNAGANLTFHALELDSQGNLKLTPRFFSHAQQAELVQRSRALIPRETDEIARHVETVVARVERENARVIARTMGFSASRRELYESDTPLGTALADALRMRVIQLLLLNNSDAVQGIEAVIAFFDSASYRQETPIAAGEFRLGDLRSALPLPTGNLGVYRISGAEVLEVFRLIRRERSREGRHSPQMSGNARERAAESGSRRRIQILGRDMRWEEINPRANYILVVDPRFMSVRYPVAGLAAILANPRRVLGNAQSPSVVDALAASLALCERFMLGDRR